MIGLLLFELILDGKVEERFQDAMKHFNINRPGILSEPIAEFEKSNTHVKTIL